MTATPKTVPVAAVVRVLRKSLHEWNGVGKVSPVNRAHLDGVLYGLAVAIDEVRKLAERKSIRSVAARAGRKKGKRA